MTVTTALSRWISTKGPLGYQRAEYRYDILGRRIEKRLRKASAIANNTVTYHQHEPDEVYSFGWVGDATGI